MMAEGTMPIASNSKLTNHAPRRISASAFSIARGMLSGRWNI